MKYLFEFDGGRRMRRIAPTLLAATALFAFDVLTPVGLAVWMFQVVLVCLSMFRADRRQIFTISAVCSVYVVAGFLLSPRERPVIWIDWANVVLCILAIAGLTAACLRMRAAEDSLRVLRGLLPICAWCRKIRNEQGGWEKLEVYIRDRSEAEFTHSICESCATTVAADPDKGKAAGS
jgi:hypothetical protein